MSLRKATAVILAVTMMAALSGCGGSGQESGNSDSGSAAQAETTENTETEPEAEGETSTDTETRDSLVITIPGGTPDPTTLAPNGASASGYTVPQIYDQLWNLTDGELIMRVATGYVQEDETHYVVTIQSGIKDTAGNEIKASDVLYSIDLAKNGTQGYPGATRYIDLEKCEVVDDTTLRVVLTQPCSFQMKALSMVNLVTQASYEASTDGMVTTPVGSGPYVLSEYVTGSYLTLDHNPEYWDGGDPVFKHITVNFVPEASQRANVMLTGESDVSCNLSYTDENALNEAEGITFSSETTIGTYVIFYNNSSNSVCGGNLDLRKAIAYAINQEAIIAASAGGYGEVSKCSTSRKFSDYSDSFVEISSDTDYYAYDTEAAKAALAASGVAEGTTIKLANGGLAGQDVIAQTIQANLAEIGLNVEIATYPDTQGQVISNQPEDWDIAVWSWTNYPAQSGLATINTFGTSDYFQLEGAEEEAFLDVLGVALAAGDDTLEKAMDDLMVYMYEELPVYGLFDTCNLQANRTDLNMVMKSQDFPLLYKWSWK